MKVAFLAMAISLCSIFSYGQQDFSQFISACGDEVTTAGSTYSWTLGELFTTEAVIVSKLEDHAFAQYGIKLLGNPVSDRIRLQADQANDLHCQLSDVHGRLLRSLSFEYTNILEIDVVNLAPQTYYLSIYSDKNQLVGTFKVVKN